MNIKRMQKMRLKKSTNYYDDEYEERTQTIITGNE